jgi:hypothetical protein
MAETTFCETVRRAAQDTDPASRFRAQAEMKEDLRRAFMCDPIATEADFERLYPRLLDEVLCQHTMRIMLELQGEERAAIREGGGLLKNLLSVELDRDEQAA